MPRPSADAGYLLALQIDKRKALVVVSGREGDQRLVIGRHKHPERQIAADRHVPTGGRYAPTIEQQSISRDKPLSRPQSGLLTSSSARRTGALHRKKGR